MQKKGQFRVVHYTTAILAIGVLVALLAKLYLIHL